MDWSAAYLQATQLIDDTQASERYSYYIRLSSLYFTRAAFLPRA
jgi:hypothetical protein